MTGVTARILDLAWLSVQDPRAGARALMTMDVPLAVRTGGLLLVAILSTLLLQPSFALLPPDGDPAGSFLAQSPLRTAVVQWGIMILSAALVFRVGRAFGGNGTFADALLLVAWLQFMMLGVQALQVLALLLVPPVAGLVGLIAFALFLWLLINFVAELHGFSRLGPVFLGILLTFLITVFVGAILLSLFVGPEAFLDV